LAAFLDKVRELITQSALPDDTKEEVETDLRTAEIQAKKPQPDTPKLTGALTNAKTALQALGAVVPEAVTIGKLVGQGIDFVSRYWPS